MLFHFVVTACSAGPAAKQARTKSRRLAAATVFVGAYQGISNGEPGAGTVEREYRFALRTAFLEVHNNSTYPPQSKNPKGEQHEDHCFI